MNNTIYYLKEKGMFFPETVVMPELKSDYVRVKNLYCGICGGDYSKYIGRRNKYGISLGHEFASTVVQVGDGVSAFDVGMIVVSDFNYRCGQCVYCRSGRSHLCNENDIELFSNRAFSDYSDIHQSYLVHADVLQDNLISATCIEPLSCAIHAVNSVPINRDDCILIMGAGNIGTAIAFYLKSILHMKNVYIKDIWEEKSNRVVQFFDCKKYRNDMVFNIIFEATDSLEGLIYALSKSMRGGRVCSVNHLYGLDTSLAYDEIVKNEIMITYPLRNGEKINIERAAQYISQDWEPAFNIMLEVSNIANINEVFEKKSRSRYNRQIISMI